MAKSIDEENLEYEKRSSKKSTRPEAGGEVRRKKKKSNPLIPVSILLSVITLASLGLCFYVIHTYQKEKAELAEKEALATQYTYTEDQANALMEEARASGYTAGQTEVTDYIHEIVVSKGGGLYEILRRLYPDEGVYSDSTGYHFVPLSDLIPRNPVMESGIEIAPDGEYSYVVNGEVRSVKGIDVSEFQGDINWEKVAQSGVKFAIVRIGYKGYGSGLLVEDAKWQQNIEGALANGIEVGVYIFDQAINEAEAIEEANFLLGKIQGYNITYPVVIDVEAPADSSARGLTISTTQRTNVVKSFCDTVRAAGYTPMVYGNNYSVFGMLDMGSIPEIPIWYAFYNTYLYCPYQTAIWQYSSTGSVNGISGNVDMNIAFPLDAPFR